MFVSPLDQSKVTAINDEDLTLVFFILLHYLLFRKELHLLDPELTNGYKVGCKYSR